MEINLHYDEEFQALNTVACVLEMLTELFLQQFEFCNTPLISVCIAFQVGEDLQQDMLTIQMVRIMDKLWLKEGIDLKMVTFSCVPTGHKRGMGWDRIFRLLNTVTSVTSSVKVACCFSSTYLNWDIWCAAMLLLSYTCHNVMYFIYRDDRDGDRCRNIEENPSRTWSDRFIQGQVNS